MSDWTIAPAIERVIEMLGMHGRERMRSAVLAANGTAPLVGLTSTEKAELAAMGVTGTRGGLTRLGANARAVMSRRSFEDAF